MNNMGWGHYTRLITPKTCWHCEYFEDLGGCRKYVCKNINDTEEFIQVEIAKQKCVYEKKQAKYPEQYPKPYEPYGWLADKKTLTKKTEA